MVFFQPGSLKIARRPEHEAQLKDEIAHGRKLGLPIDFVSLTEAKRLMPFLETTAIRAITHMRTDIYLEPAQIALGYCRAAGKLGVTPGSLRHIIISEASDELAATAVSLSVAALGNVRTQTLRAFDAKDLATIVSKMA
jgi:4-methylaminobutanoate oxidase (formaldehyde-forming)